MSSYVRTDAEMPHSCDDIKRHLRPWCGRCRVWILGSALALAILDLAGCASPRARAPAVAQHPAKPIAKPAPAVPGIAAIGPHTYGRDKDRTKLAMAKNDHDSLPPAEAGYYMDVLQGRLKQFADKSTRITRSGDRIVIDLASHVDFDSGSAQITPIIQETLSPLSKTLVEYRMTVVSVQARSEDSDTQTLNPQLAEQRALAVAHYLTSAGVAHKRIVIADVARAPAATGSNESRARLELQIEPIVRPSNAER